MVSLYSRNMEVLRRRYPHLLDLLSNVGSKIKVFRARDKGYSCILEERGGVLLHSRIDPEKEVERLVSGWRIDGFNTIFLLGMGLGWPLFKLYRLIRADQRLIVIEKEMEFFFHAIRLFDLQEILSQENVKLIIGRAPDEIQEEIDPIIKKRVKILRFPPCIRIFKGYYDEVEGVIMGCIKKKGIRPTYKIAAFLPKAGYSIPYIAEDAVSALKELGQDVEVIDLKKERTIKDLTSKIHTFRPDFIFTIDHVGLETPLFKGLRIHHVSWCTVNPFFWLQDRDISPYIHLFLWDRSYIDELKEVGLQNLHHLPLATNPKIFKKLSLNMEDMDRYGCDVSFAGAWREERWELLCSVAEYKVIAYGYGSEWGKVSHPGIEYRGLIDNRDELPRLYNATKINLNTTHPTLRTTVPVRVFDIASCEGFLLTDFREDLVRFFKEGEEVVYFRNKDEFREMVSFYLKNPSERKKVARMARERVLKEHTFFHRMEELLSVIGERI